MLFADTCHRHGSESYVERSLAGWAVQLLGTWLRPYPEFSVATRAFDLDLVRLLCDPEDMPEQAEHAKSSGLSELPASTTVLQ